MKNLLERMPHVPYALKLLRAANLADVHSPGPKPEVLSARELEVLRLIAQGKTNREIADQLVIALSTVKTHVNNVYGKLGASRRTQAIGRARELDLL